MPKNKREYLTTNQKLAIQLAVEGKGWGEIAKQVKVSNVTLWEWRRNPLFQQELTETQEAMLNEMSLSFSQYMLSGYEALKKIADNVDKEFEQKYQYESACKLVELPMCVIEKLKLFEHHRREIKFEDEIKTE